MRAKLDDLAAKCPHYCESVPKMYADPLGCHWDLGTVSISSVPIPPRGDFRTG